MAALCARKASDDYLHTTGADNSSLPGMGGLFNTTNCHLYHYEGNNPVRYVDPDGRDAKNNTPNYILLRLENPIVLPSYDGYGNRKIDRNWQKVSFEIDTLVVKPGEYACGAFDGGRDVNGNYFKVTAIEGTVVSFIVTETGIYIFDGGFINFVVDMGRVIKNFGKESFGKGYKEYSGFKKAGSDGAKFLEDAWGDTFDSDLKDENGNIMKPDDAYNTIKQVQLRSYLNQTGPLSKGIMAEIE